MSLPVVSTTWEVVESLQVAFNTYWQARPIVTFLSWDNVPTDVVKSNLTVVSSDPVVSGEAMVLVQIQHAAGFIAALGTRRHRQVGIMSAAVYVEKGRGRIRTAGKIADQALNFFQTQNVPGVSFRDPRIVEVGGDGKWWQVNVLAEFQYDILRSI
jgi:hypothetical protein